ncbi:MAG: DUF2334 domain-containing protein [Tepidisphaeraceae bacterium]|jgi:hypothetical protein
MLKNRSLILVICLLTAMVATGNDDRPGPPENTAAAHPVRRILLISDAAGEYDEGRSRLMNLLDGMGLDFDVRTHTSSGTNLAQYQLVIVAPTTGREIKIGRPLERAIIDAIARGTNVLWIGGGIWGTFTTTELSDAFGLRYTGQGWSTDARVARAGFVNAAGQSDHLTVYKENLYRVEAVKARMEGSFLDAAGQPLAIPFITHYRANERSGQAVYMSLQMFNYWKAEESDDTFARAEVVLRYIRRLTSDGSVGKHPVRDGHQAVFVLRLEDYLPGGSLPGHTGRPWLIRMERLLELCRENELPLNIALVPVYRDPFRGENHDWDEDDPAISTLQRQAKQAFDDGGSLVVHGYTHQHGNGPSNYSGGDWEVWDNVGQRFLPFAEQKAITENAYAEVVRQFGIRPTIWETPHYVGNTDTARAAYGAGFRYLTESDTKLFPNRQGYLDRMKGLVLNIPETAFDYPNDGDEIKRSAILRQKHLLPRLVGMNGLVYLFYHNTNRNQERALENLLTEARKFDLWKPDLEQYAGFWEKREQARIKSTIDPAARQVIADVTASFQGLTLSVRLPDGTMPGEVAIDGKPAKARSQQIDRAWYIYPVLPDAKACRVVIGFQKAPSPGGT